MKTIRPFVEWNVDLRRELTPAQKGKITRYYNELEKLRNRPHVIYRPRSTKAKKAARKYAGGISQTLPGLKAFPIPTNNPDKAKITFTGKKGIKVNEAGSTRTFIKFSDPIALARDPENYVAGLVKNRNEEFFQIALGLRDSLGTFQKPFVAEAVARIMHQYGTAKDFVRGLYAINLGKQETIDEYLTARGKAREDQAKAAKARKRKNASEKKKNNRRGLRKRSV